MSYPPPFTRPAAFEWRDVILTETPFVLFIAVDQGTLHTARLPIRVSPDGVLHGHMQRGNPLADLREGHRVRIVALGRTATSRR